MSIIDKEVPMIKRGRGRPKKVQVEEKNPIDFSEEKLFQSKIINEKFVRNDVLVSVPSGLSPEQICLISTCFHWDHAVYHEDGSWQFVPLNTLPRGVFLHTNADNALIQLVEYKNKFLADINLNFTIIKTTHENVSKIIQE